MIADDPFDARETIKLDTDTWLELYTRNDMVRRKDEQTRLFRLSTPLFKRSKRSSSAGYVYFQGKVPSSNFPFIFLFFESRAIPRTISPPDLPSSPVPYAIFDYAALSRYGSPLLSA